MEKEPRVKPAAPRSTARRDLLLGILAGALALGFLAWGIASMSRDVSGGWIEGVIVAKHFTPQPEEQVTVGKGGLRERTLDGEYTLEVRVGVENGKTYTVWVDKRDFEARKVGDPFRFPRPREESR